MLSYSRLSFQHLLKHMVIKASTKFARVCVGGAAHLAYLLLHDDCSKGLLILVICNIALPISLHGCLVSMQIRCLHAALTNADDSLIAHEFKIGLQCPLGLTPYRSLGEVTPH